MKLKRLLMSVMCRALGLLTPAFGAGTLTPVGQTAQPIRIRDHQVNVTLNNGFAQTEVIQTFFNPNSQDLEGIYAFPLPKSSSLSEVTLITGEKTLEGEVLPKKEAEAIYEEEKKAGNDTGLASKNDIQRYEFRVSPIRANSEVKLRFVYYQPIEIDTGVGRYLYPMEDGGTDDAAKSFWTTHTDVDGTFSVKVTLKSAVPVTDVRAPGFDSAVSQKVDDGHYTLTLDRTGAKLDRDFVFYYRLAENLPGRVEVIPYRADPSKPGTFMMVVTPGLDLKPITRGADYVYVLDTSGSMQGKIHTLANGVGRALGAMRSEDRFRVVTFNTHATELIPWMPATPENVQNAISVVKGIKVTGSTNLYDGISKGLEKLDADRATSLVLVTDGVTNAGIVDPARFHALLKQVDLRFFSFLMGNSANWPLMRTLADATGGFYAGVSNEDDILGQIMLAKSKVTYESLRNASFTFAGVRVFATTGDFPQKIYQGQQLVIFGRYESEGETTLTLKAKLTGEDKTYRSTFRFPATDTANPEIERLWALAQIEQIELKESMGALPASESRDAILNLGVTYQLVTDHTSMVLLDDSVFAKRGIARNNQQRVATERQAQQVRAQGPAQVSRVDQNQPMFTGNAPHVSQRSPSGNGGGAIEPNVANALLFLLLVGAALYARKHLSSR